MENQYKNVIVKAAFTMQYLLKSKKWEERLFRVVIIK